jgi:hypothetical protein
MIVQFHERQLRKIQINGQVTFICTVYISHFLNVIMFWHFNLSSWGRMHFPSGASQFSETAEGPIPEPSFDMQTNQFPVLPPQNSGGNNSSFITPEPGTRQWGDHTHRVCRNYSNSTTCPALPCLSCGNPNKGLCVFWKWSLSLWLSYEKSILRLQ